MPERTRGAACARAAGPSGQFVPSWSPFSRKAEDHRCPRKQGAGFPAQEAEPGGALRVSALPTAPLARRPDPLAHGWKQESAPGSRPQRKGLVPSCAGHLFGRGPPTPKLPWLDGFRVRPRLWVPPGRGPLGQAGAKTGSAHPVPPTGGGYRASNAIELLTFKGVEEKGQGAAPDEVAEGLPSRRRGGGGKFQVTVLQWAR